MRSFPFAILSQKRVNGQLGHKVLLLDCLWKLQYDPLRCSSLECKYWYFGPRVYAKGSLVIGLVRVCVCVGMSVFRYLRDRSLVFSDFCMKLGHHKGTKVSELDFWKKILGGAQMGEKPHNRPFPFLLYYSGSV